MLLNDRLTQGFIAGVAGGIVMNVFSHLAYSFNYSNLRLLDWPAYAVLGRTPEGFWELAFFQIVQLIFTGFLGVIFAYLISELFTSANHLFKGWLFGVIAWFAIYWLTYIADVPELTPLTVGTALTDFIVAMIYGVSLAEVLSRLDNREALG